MHEVDRAIVAACAEQGVTLHEGDVPTEQSPHDPAVKVVTVAIPYAVLFSNLGDDNQPRLGGVTSQRSVFWQITYVGLTMEQAKWIGGKVRRALKDRRLEVFVADPLTGAATAEKYRTGLVGVDESQRVRADHEASDPQGRPLFFGIDLYSIKVSNKRLA